MDFKKLIYLILFLTLLNQVYSVNVSVEWNHTIDYGSEEPFSITIDSSGNSYVAGYSETNMYIISYDINGNHRWNQTIESSAALSITVDSNTGNSYVTGEYNNGGDREVYILSYNSTGSQRWNKTISGGVGGYDFGETIVVANSENIYLSGVLSNASSTGLMYVTSYNSSGDHRWNKTILGGGEGFSLKIDSSENVYAVGRVSNGVDYDFFVISYNSTGDYRWNKTINYFGFYDDALSIVLDGSGNSYIISQTFNGSDILNYILSYNSTGSYRWNQSFLPGGSQGDGEFHLIDIDNSQNVYFICNYNNDIYIMSYNSTGFQRWNTSIDYSNDYDVANSIVVDGEGNSYIAGYVHTASHPVELVYVSSYNSTGAQRWNKSVIFGNDGDNAYTLAVDSSRNVYVTGYSYNPINSDIFVLKISEDAIVPVSSSSSARSNFPVYGIFSIVISFVMIWGHFIFS